MPRSEPTPATRRSWLVLLGAVVASALMLAAWFPAKALLSQRSSLAGTEAQLSGLHAQDAALAQEKKNLGDPGEIGRIAREQYQLVNPGQQAYEVLPPSGAASSGTPYAGDPGSDAPVIPSATPELPPGDVTTTTTATGAGPAPVWRGKQSSHGQSSSGTLLSRIADTLEFWR